MRKIHKPLNQVEPLTDDELTGLLKFIARNDLNERTTYPQLTLDMYLSNDVTTMIDLSDGL